MALKKFVNITPAELKAKGVVALADKPNITSSYGVGGLSPTALKLWFDQLSKFLAGKINVIQDALSGEDAGSYLKLDLKGLDPDKEEIKDFEYSLQDLCDSFLDGNFAKFLKLYESASEEELKSLQTIINQITADISSGNEALEAYKRLLISKDGAANIGLPDKYDEAKNKKLSDLIDDIFNLRLAAKLMIESYGLTAATKTAKTNKTLQAYINEITGALQAANGSILLDMINNRYTKTESDNKLQKKVADEIAAHNTNPTSHSQAMALKFDKDNVMAEFTGEDVNNVAKVASAAALKKVVDAINESISGVNGKAELAIKDIAYDPVTGVMTFTKTNGTTVEYDLPSEKILKSGASYYDAKTKKLHLVLMDDTDVVIDVANLVDEYFGDDETVELTTVGGKKTFRIKPAYKETLDNYGVQLGDHQKELERLEQEKVNTKDIVDNLITDAADKPVSAKQAKALKDAADALEKVVQGTYKGATYDKSTGSLTLTKNDGTKDVVNFPLESFVEDAQFDPETNVVTLTIANGKSVTFDLSALIDYYYGDDETIEVYDDADDNFKHKIRVKATFLDGVKASISGIDERLKAAEENIKYLERIDELGSIGRADGETITMDEENGHLTAHKLQLSDGKMLDFIRITKAAYDELEEKDSTALYLVDDDSRLDIILDGKRLFSSGVKDTEANKSITFRVITQAAYEGLATKDASKLYIINKNGGLAFAFGDLYLDTNVELLNSLQGRIEDLEETTEKMTAELQLAHSTLKGSNKTTIFAALAVSGVTLTSGTLSQAERCLQC